VATPPAYFERLDDGSFQPSAHTGGAWNDREQHISPMVGLIAHLVEQHVAGTDKHLRRLSVDILGVLTFDPFTVEVRTIRPGRTIELVEATVTAGGRTAVLARAWVLSPHDSAAVAGGAGPGMTPPEELVDATLDLDLWPGGYIRSLEGREVRPTRPGSAELWLATEVEILAGEPVSELAAFCGLVDTSNGISVRESPEDWLFPNVDLTIHLHRAPRGRWVGLRTEVVFGADGSGVTSAVLHDASGPVGRAAQVLTVRPRS